jgi:hypothetical protein
MTVYIIFHRIANVKTYIVVFKNDSFSHFFVREKKYNFQCIKLKETVLCPKKNLKQGIFI